MVSLDTDQASDSIPPSTSMPLGFRVSLDDEVDSAGWDAAASKRIALSQAPCL